MAAYRLRTLGRNEHVRVDVKDERRPVVIPTLPPKNTSDTDGAAGPVEELLTPLGLIQRRVDEKSVEARVGLLSKEAASRLDDCRARFTELSRKITESRVALERQESLSLQNPSPSRDSFWQGGLFSSGQRL